MTPSSTSHIQPLLKLARNTPPWMAYVPIALVTLLGVLVTWHAFNTVTDWERQRVQQAFRAAAIDRVLMVQREIEQNLGVVQDIGSFFDASKCPRFRINETSQAGDLVSAEQRPVHFPVLYVQPYPLNKEALGLDLASDPVILDALQWTRCSKHGMPDRCGFHHAFLCNRRTAMNTVSWPDSRSITG